jgi:hypothetical protein
MDAHVASRYSQDLPKICWGPAGLVGQIEGQQKSSYTTLTAAVDPKKSFVFNAPKALTPLAGAYLFQPVCGSAADG